MKFSPSLAPAIGDAMAGRRQEFNQVVSLLQTDSVLLQGPRRIGKTSLLRSICESNEVNKKFDFYYLHFDTSSRSIVFESYPNVNSASRIARIANRIQSFAFGENISPKDKKDFLSAFFQMVDKATERGVHSEKLPVFIIDDVDQLVFGLDGQGTELLLHLRSVRQERRNVRFLIAGESVRYALALVEGRVHTAALNDLITVWLGPLSFDDSTDLLNKWLVGHANWTINRLAWFSDGYPDLLVRLCLIIDDSEIMNLSALEKTEFMISRIQAKLSTPSKDSFGFEQKMIDLRRLTSKLYGPIKSAEVVNEVEALLDHLSVGQFAKDELWRSQSQSHGILKLLEDTGIVSNREGSGIRISSKLFQTWWFNRPDHSMRSRAFWPFHLPIESSPAKLKSFSDGFEYQFGDTSDQVISALNLFHQVELKLAAVVRMRRSVTAGLFVDLAEQVVEALQRSLAELVTDSSAFVCLLGRDRESWARTASSGFPFFSLAIVDEVVEPLVAQMEPSTAAVFSLEHKSQDLSNLKIRSAALSQVEIEDDKNSFPFAILAFFSRKRIPARFREDVKTLLSHASNKIAFIASISSISDRLPIRGFEKLD